MDRQEASPWTLRATQCGVSVKSKRREKGQAVVPANLYLAVRLAPRARATVCSTTPRMVGPTRTCFRLLSAVRKAAGATQTPHCPEVPGPRIQIEPSPLRRAQWSVVSNVPSLPRSQPHSQRGQPQRRWQRLQSLGILVASGPLFRRHRACFRDRFTVRGRRNSLERHPELEQRAGLCRVQHGRQRYGYHRATSSRSIRRG